MKKLQDYLYYETELGKLYCGDSLEILPLIKEKVDLVLTDPPYGVNIANDGFIGGKKKAFSRGGIVNPKNYMPQEWDNKIPDKKIFELIFNKSKNQIIFGGNYFIEYLYNSSCWIVWDKDNGASYFADCELAWTSFKTAVRKYKYRWNGLLQEYMGKQKEIRYHPTQKPYRLFMQILNYYSKENELILDPFVGSGTTAIACEKLNRRWIGIEISENYCAIAKKRIMEEANQIKMELICQ